MSLEATEAECAAGRTAPRVSLADIEASISGKYFRSGLEATDSRAGADRDTLGLLTLCIIVMRNGFTIVGKSAPASPANYDRALGEKLAYEDAVRQIWPLMGFALRERLASQ